MNKLQKEFEKFHNSIKADEVSALREKRDKLKKDIEESFPEKCKKVGIEIKKSDLRFINQGSYKIGTTISSEHVDLDYAVIFPLDIEEYSDPRVLKKAARDSLLIANVRIPEIKEPCVTVAYHRNGEEYMHIDFPLYAEKGSQLYLARGKEFSQNYEWEKADPEGLSAYFIDQFSGNDQLKRIVRYIKKWKQVKYGNSRNTNEVPPSVGLTLLACENYVSFTNDENDDLSSLYYTMKNIKNKFTITTDSEGNIVDATINCDLPVCPYSDVFYKLRNSTTHMITFYKRVCKAVENLLEAINLSEEHEAAKYVVKVLGDEFEIPPKKANETSTSNKKEYCFG